MAACRFRVATVVGNQNMSPVPGQQRKDLQDLQNLARSPLLSYAQKTTQPRASRRKVAALAPSRYPLLAAFLPNRIIEWGWQYLSHRIGPRHPFLSYEPSDVDDGVYKLTGGEEVRIALAGDWGTGTDEAEHVAQLIHKFAPHYSIHLGDVYYVGGYSEVNENFLGIGNPNNDYAPCQWPGGSHGSFALNGNHEMYARGFAYFDRMLPRLGLISDGKPDGQKASYFCLENDDWRVIALDTGYNSIGWPLLEYIFRPSCALRPEEIDWLRRIAPPKVDDPRGIILLTHHQYYSAYDVCYTTQARQIAEFFPGPVLWFWGHEHRMAIYEEYGVSDGVRAFGRCIGHGGMPVELPPRRNHSACVVEFTDRRHYHNDENLKIGYNGFARLIFRGKCLTVDYVDLYGEIIFSEDWKVDSGNLQRTRADKHA
jgi:hypothetical protein